MYYSGMDTTEIQPITTVRKTTVRKAYRGKRSKPNRKPMYRTDSGQWLPWSFNTEPGKGSLVPISSDRVTTRTPFFGFSKSLSARRKPGSGRSKGGLGEDDIDEVLGLSFNVPALTSAFTPSSMLSPVTPTSGASSFWSPFESITNLWNNRPEALRKIRIRVNPTKVAQLASKVLPPSQVGKAVDYARRMGIDPTYLSQFGEVPITGDMARYGYEARATDWSGYLPWILGAGAAVVLLPMVLGKK